MIKIILKITFFLFLLVSFASCSARKRSKKAADSFEALHLVNEAGGKTFAKEYSQKLGIPVPESSNKVLISTISEWIGVPYKYGGNDKKGIDCSGFIHKVYPLVYQFNVPRVTVELQEKSLPVKKGSLREGDLVFFKINTAKVGHAGIFLFDDYFVHASTSRGVMISRLGEAYWAKYFVGGGRFSP